MAFLITGNLSVTCLSEALKRLSARHEILRTFFSYENGTLYQNILPDCTHELAALPVQQNDLQETLEKAVRQPFDIQAAPPVRFLLVNTDSGRSVFLAVFHHIIADFTTLSVFSSELGTIYNALLKGNEIPLEPLHGQFSTHALWENEWSTGPNAEKMLQYWEKELKDRPKTHIFHAEKSITTAAPYDGNVHTISYARGELVRLQEYSRKQRVNEFVTLCAAYLMTLNRFSGSRSMVVGVPLTNRRQVTDENVMSCLANMLPLRFTIDSGKNVGDLLHHVRSQLLLAHRHQEISLNQIIARVKPERDVFSNPLYQVGFTLRKPYPFSIDLDDCETGYIELPFNSSMLDLYCMAGIDDEAVRIRFEYNKLLITSDHIGEFASAYNESLACVLSGPETPLSQYLGRSATSPGKDIPADATESDEDTHNFVIISSFTGDPLVEPLRFWAEKQGIHGNFSDVINFQVFQQLFDNTSEFAQNSGGTSIILLRVEDWIRGANTSSGLADNWDAGTLRGETNNFLAALKAAAGRNTGRILLCICHPSPDVRNTPERNDLNEELHTHIRSACDEIGGITTLFPEDIDTFYHIENYHDALSLKQAIIPYTLPYYTALATVIARKLYTMIFPPYKIVAVDADNTLWSGVLGEDGVEGITITEPHRQFQSKLVELHENGILLCLVSKNDDVDIKNAFEYHHDMPLRLDHFVLRKVNWNPKSRNIREISEELDLGIDSIVFIDDNPVECGEVQMNCPEVLTIRFMSEPDYVERIIKHLWAFDCGRVTTEDRKRTRQYRENIDRRKFFQEVGSFAKFIEELNIQIAVTAASPENYPRVSQMTFRINQFRTAPGRLTEQDVKRMLADDTYEAFIVTVSDRYGDYGAVGLMELKQEKNALHIKRILLSCRVLGKGVEHNMISFAGRKAVEYGLSDCVIEFTELERNKPAEQFLEQIAKEYRQNEHGKTLYRLPSQTAASITFNPAEFEHPETTLKQQKKQSVEKSAPLAAFRNDFVRTVFESLYSIESIQRQLSDGAKAHEVKTPLSHVSEQLTPLESEMADIWKTVLGLSSISVSENFFDLGGQSIQIPQVISKFNERTGHTLEILDIFKYPTIRSLVKIGINSESESVGPDMSAHDDRASKRARTFSKRRNALRNTER